MVRMVMRQPKQNDSMWRDSSDVNVKAATVN